MATGEEKSGDFYDVMGLKKECSAADLRNAYKKLALRWHPDRCSGSGNTKYIEEAKKKFQAIQEAYSDAVWFSLSFAVLSDTNKRFMYDVGVYDCDDDENNGNGEESFEELRDLFEETFHSDIEAFGTSHTHPCSSSSYASCSSSSNATNKRYFSEMNSDKASNENPSGFHAHAHFEGFCFGAEHHVNRMMGKRAGG